MSVSNLASENAHTISVEALNAGEVYLDDRLAYTTTFAAVANPIALDGRKGDISVTAIGGGFASGATVKISLTGPITASDMCILQAGPYAGVATQNADLKMGVVDIATGLVEIEVTNVSSGAYGATSFVISFLLI